MIWAMTNPPAATSEAKPTDARTDVGRRNPNQDAFSAREKIFLFGFVVTL